MKSSLIELSTAGNINNSASIKDQQSIIINAPIEQVWSILSAIESWSSWNKTVTNIRLADNKSSFKWKSYGKNQRSEIRKIEAPLQLSFTSKTKWINIVYSWTLEKTESYQTIATVEVSLEGFMVSMFFSHGKLNADLLNWLTSLKSACEKSVLA